MQFDLTDDQREIQEVARCFTDRITPFAPERFVSSIDQFCRLRCLDIGVVVNDSK